MAVVSDVDGFMRGNIEVVLMEILVSAAERNGK